jgi:RND family efflux transporter MFP subunit
MPFLLVAACASHEQIHSVSKTATETDVTKANADSHTVDCVAVISSAESQAISPLSDGSVMKVLVKDGDFVRAGDLIAQIDTADLRDQRAKIEGDRARAAGEAGRAYAEAANAERKAALMRRMAQAGVSSESEYRDAMATASGASAGGGAAAGAMKAADAQIKETDRLIAAADLKAPMDGIVSAIKFHAGEVPHKGVTLARVFNPAKLQAKFALPRDKADLVKRGDHVDLVYEGNRKVGATVTDIVDTHDVAIDFLTVVADLDKNSPRGADLQVGVRGVVHLADKGVAR